MSVNETLAVSVPCLEVGEALELNYNISDVTLIPYVAYTAIFFYSLIFCFACVGNTCLILGIARHTQLQTVRNFFILNLAVSDLLVALTSLPVTAYTNLYKSWIFWPSLCHTIAMFQSMGITNSAFTLAAVSVDRYVLIVHPTRPAINNFTAKVIVSGIWTTGILVSIPSVMHYHVQNGYAAGICGYFCMEQWEDEQENLKIYSWSLLMVQFVLPLAVIGLCYFLIYRRLQRGMQFRSARRANTNFQAISGSKNLDREKANRKRHQRTNLVLTMMVIFFVLAWMPRTFANFASDYNFAMEFQKQQPYLMSVITHSIAMTSTFWNPMLYGFMNESFRPVFLKMLRDVRHPFSHVRQNPLSSEISMCKPSVANGMFPGNRFPRDQPVTTSAASPATPLVSGTLDVDDSFL